MEILKRRNSLGRIRHIVNSYLANRSIAKSFSQTLGTNVLVLLLALVTSSVTARALGSEGRGELAQIQLYGTFLIGLGHFALPDALTYYVSRDRENAGMWIASAWAIFLPLSAFWIIVGFFALPYLLQTDNPEVILFARLFLLVIPFTYMQQTNAFLGLKAFGYAAMMRLFKPAVYALLIIIIVLLHWATPFSFALSWMIASILGPPLVFWARRRLGVKPRRPNLKAMGNLLKFGVPTVLGTLPDTLNARLDQLIIAAWLPARDLGLYVVSVAWATIASSVFNSIGMTSFPYVASVKENDKRLAMVGTMARVSLVTAIIIGCGMFIATPVVFRILFGESFVEAIPVALVLVIANIFYNYKVVLLDGAMALGIPQINGIAELISLVITVILLALTLRTWGIMGAAITSVFAYAFGSCLMIFLLLRNTDLKARQLLVITRDDLKIIRDRGTRIIRSIRNILRPGNNRPISQADPTHVGPA